MKNKYFFVLCLTSLVMPGANATAGEADVLKATAKCNQVNCTFNVTVKHADQGWKHYADKWDVLTTDGKLLATRTLHHPHVKEQPFTRSLGNITVPPEVKKVVIRAHDSVHGYGGKELIVDIERIK